MKTRRSFRFGTGEESVDQRKLLKLAKAAQIFLSERTTEEPDWRIDLMVIEGIGRHFFRLRYYQNLAIVDDEKLLDDS